MLGSANAAGMPDVGSSRAFFGREIARHNQALEIRLKSTPDFSHPGMLMSRRCVGPINDWLSGSVVGWRKWPWHGSWQ
jgi:hypothetical protein